MTLTLDDSEAGERLRGEFRAIGKAVPAHDATRMLESLSSKLFDQGRPVNVGRFEVRERLGAGAMGVVMSGFDPQLHRTVALKVLHSAGDDVEQARLLAEARAMAKVRHPNLVTVFEAGTHDGSVYIAMEFVEGGTLGAWLEAQSRTWQEVVPVFIGIAKGLAAIHDAGLVHRDLKPENILLGSDGRAQVSDFGLARPESAAVASSVEVSEDGDPAATPTLGRAGTPSYFAPEQWKGARADVATDQWSFCVTLYEALYGQRPFAAKGRHGLSTAVLDGVRTPLPSAAPTLPAWLLKIVERGLSLDPAERFGSMHELGSALQAGTERGRPRPVRVAALTALATAGIAGAGVLAVAEDPCQGVDVRLETVWTPERAAKISARFDVVQPGGPSIWATIEESLDRRVEQWAAQRRDACEATHVRGEQSENALDLRMRCLDRRAVEIESLLETYDDVSEAGVLRAFEPFKTLGEQEVCDDLAFLQRAQPTPESAHKRDAVAKLRERSARIATADRGDDLDAIRLDAIRLVEDADAIDYEPVLAEAKLAHAKVESLLGHGPLAAQLYEQAFEHALATHHLEVQVWAAVVASFVYATQLRDIEEAKQWGRQADALLRAHPDFPATNALLVNRGATALQANELDRARGFFEEALERLDASGLIESKDAIDIEANLAILERRAGNLELALTRMKSAQDKARKLLGDSHPRVGQLSTSVAHAYLALERFEEAEAEYRHGLRMLELNVGSDAEPVGHPLYNLGNLLVGQKRYEDALPLLDRAISVWRHHHGDDDPLLVNAYWSRGQARLEMGQPKEAAVDLERALTLMPEQTPPDQEGSLLYRLVQAHTSSDLDRARVLVKRALGLKLTDETLIGEFQDWSRAHP